MFGTATPFARTLSPLLTLAVLLLVGGIQLAGRLQAVESDAEQGLGRLIESVPPAAGSWVGRAVSTPAPAMTPLRGLDFGAWVYENIETGMQVTVFCVVAQDRRDLAGYAPVRWHTAQGWQVEASTPRTWQVAGRPIPTQVHDLSGSPGGEPAERVVISCVILPDGRVRAQLDDAPVPASSATTADAAGAAMIQLTFAAQTPHSVMAQVIQALMASAIEETG